jgi:hypothetical protein
MTTKAAVELFFLINVTVHLRVCTILYTVQCMQCQYVSPIFISYLRVLIRLKYDSSLYGDLRLHLAFKCMLTRINVQKGPKFHWCSQCLFHLSFLPYLKQNYQQYFCLLFNFTDCSRSLSARVYS